MALNLFNCSLWGDEAFSAVLAQKPFIPMLKIVAKDTSPPLFYIISFIWFRLFGSSEIAIRSLSFIFYLATIIFIYLIAKKLFGKAAAVFSAVLTFFNPFLFPYAFEGRMYYSLLFFVVLSFYFLIKKNRLGYIIGITLSLYSHHFSVFAIFAQFIWRIITKEQPFKKIIQDYLIAAVLYLPWLYPLYLQTSLVAGGFWLGKPTPKDLAGLFWNFISGELIYRIQRVLPILAIICLSIRRWSRKKFADDLFLILWAICPPILTFLISQTKLSIFYDRYLLYSIPPIMIILASRLRKVSFLPIIAIILIYAIVSEYKFNHPFKKPFREFAQWIKENISSNTVIVNYNGKSHHLWESKYYGIEAPLLVESGKLPFYVGTAQMTKDDVVGRLPENKEIGVITSDDPYQIRISGHRVKDFYQLDSLYFVWLKDEKEN